jgi:hypothetical protein
MSNKDSSELAEEIHRGEQAFKDLAQHLYAMGAQSMSRSIAIENVLIEINAVVRVRINDIKNIT